MGALRLLHGAAGLVGEFAEVHLEGVGGAGQHVDVRARTEHPVDCAGHRDHAHLGVLKAQVLQHVIELDVYAHVIAVELELVARTKPPIFLNVHLQGGPRAVQLQEPVGPVVGFGSKRDGGLVGHIGHVAVLTGGRSAL